MAKILMVEDNDSLARSVRAALEARGHRVTRIAKAKQPFQGADDFDVILCDYELPDGTGLDFYQAIVDGGPVGTGARHTTWILWSGNYRGEEVAAHPVGDTIDYVLVKTDIVGMLDIVEQAVAR